MNQPFSEFVPALLTDGDRHFTSGDYTTARSCYEIALTHTDKQEHELYSDILLRLGMTQKLGGFDQEAIATFEYVLSIRAMDSSDTSLYLLQMLCELYEQTGQYAKALEHYKKFDHLQDTRNKEEKNVILQDIQHQFNTKQVEYERELFRLKNDDLAQTLSVVEQLNEELAIVNNEKNKLLGAVANDLKYPLDMIYIYIQSFKNPEEHYSAENVKNIAQNIESLAGTTYQMIQKLLQSNAEETLTDLS